MATTETAVAAPQSDLKTPYKLDLNQTTQACKVLLKHIADEKTRRSASSTKPNLLAGGDDHNGGEDDAGNDTPVWLIVTTKQHIADKNRLKPSKILLPHPINTNTPNESTICLITADRTNTPNLLISPLFPSPLRTRITRTITLSKLKTSFKSFEARRKLLAEHDTFLADDRIVTFLPNLLGKVFYKGANSKRPIPISIAAPPLRGADGKRLKAAEGKTKRPTTTGANAVVDAAEEDTEMTNAISLDVKENANSAAALLKEITKALSSALIHLSPASSTAIKVGLSSQNPIEISANINAVVTGLVDKFITKGWRNVRAIHVKGPNTVAFPIWLASELWVEESDVRDVKKQFGKTKEERSAGRAERRAIAGKAAGGKGKMVEGVSAGKAIEGGKEEGVVKSKKRKNDAGEKGSEAMAKPAKKKKKAEVEEKMEAELVLRKEKLRRQKEEALKDAEGV